MVERVLDTNKRKFGTYMNRVFIIHGWGGYPEECWFPWLKQKLEQRGFHVEVPQMPEPSAPKIETWVAYLAQRIATPDQDTYLVGHSIGVQTILRYLETIENQIGGVVAVAGFFTLIPDSIGGPKEEKIAEPWLTRPMNLDKIKKTTIVLLL
jgi:predicted alpha/beta hydrolase family esterase